VDALQAHLENLTFCDIDEADLRASTDAAFVKLFRVAQLTIEYLLHVQNSLQAYAGSMRAQAAEAEVEDARTQVALRAAA
jgi:zinc finger protein DZIP1